MKRADRIELRGYRRFNRAMKRKGIPIRMMVNSRWTWEIMPEKTVEERKEILNRMHREKFGEELYG